ncbi:flavodoxin [Carboxylicivirga linearis]|uniref:Flavodoxin n=1 Tax=Carboxylicivirga linearis TaxID=1628157 RepID=A0ABS5JZZ1_9BACT|nr:flavodoxin [Carboxylicivirga linearis]MBS2100446.1 flavodoxin [Carboxylicivirga linearis]
MKQIAILYGSSSGNTEAVARLINTKLGNEAKLIDVAAVNIAELKGFEALILGTSTWGLGDLQDDWEDFIPELEKVDMSGKTVALFGLGDAESYPDTFVDGMGTIYDCIVEKGCKIVGQVPAVDYRFEASTALKDNSLVGLAIDEDNESDKTNERIESWINSIKDYLN